MRYLFPLPLKTEKGVIGILLVLSVLIVTSNELWSFKNTYDIVRRSHLEAITKFRQDRENWTTSVLGSWLFKHNKTVRPEKKVYLVHVYKSLPIAANLYQGCSVRNCYFIKDDRILPKADAVLFNLHDDGFDLPKYRRPQQRWIFLNQESPKSALKKKIDITDLANVFNWSMSYRTDSDIPFTYGRTVEFEEPVLSTFDLRSLTKIIPNWERKRRDVLVSILMSHCNEFIMKFVKDMQKHTRVDVFGSCSTKKSNKSSCPGQFGIDCDEISVYLFYLALENSDCQEYLTEKIWYNAYMKGAIPIIMGPPLSDCERLLPPNSFIYIPKNYTGFVLSQLAQRITDLNNDIYALLSLHQWRNHFNVTFDYGYFGTKSVLLCRLCEGLNYNDKKIKIYNESDIRLFLDPELLCGK